MTKFIESGAAKLRIEEAATKKQVQTACDLLEVARSGASGAIEEYSFRERAGVAPCSRCLSNTGYVLTLRAMSSPHPWLDVTGSDRLWP